MKTFEYDFKNKDFVVHDGRLVPTEDISVWIEKILRSEKGRCLIYEDTNYGVVLEDLLIGTNYPRSFVESEVKREIEDALYQNPRIRSVENLKLTDDNIIEFEVLLNDEKRVAGTVTL